MIQEVQKTRRRADELTQIWETYFPNALVGVEYWMVALDDFPFNVIAPAIKQCARKKVQLKGEISVDQMLTYTQSVSRSILKEKITLGIYPDKHRPEAGTQAGI